jgi:hypothetical protein
MFWGESEESAEYLLATALGHGYRVSRSELHRWQQCGLIPAPRQRGLGRGRGSVVSYDPGSARQLVAVFRRLWWDRSSRIALFRLWWDGYPVDEAQLRDFLNRLVVRLARYRDLLEEGDGDSPDNPNDVQCELDRRARGRLCHRALTRLRRAVGKERFTSLARLLFEAGLGLFEVWYDPAGEFQLFAKAFGLEHSSFDLQLRTASRLLNLDNARIALRRASLQDLEQARDELRALLDYWLFYSTPERIWNLEKALGKRAAHLLALLLNDSRFYRRALHHLFLAVVAAQVQGPEMFTHLIGNRENPCTIPNLWPAFSAWQGHF